MASGVCRSRRAQEDLEREWAELVEPGLPKVRERLWANLLLAALWDNVLDERQRRMLWRMTLLRRPWEWGLMAHLGDASEDAATAEATAESLCRTSLLETTELADRPHYTLHPATAAFVRSRRGTMSRCVESASACRRVSGASGAATPVHRGHDQGGVSPVRGGGVRPGV